MPVNAVTVGPLLNGQMPTFSAAIAPVQAGMADAYAFGGP